MLDRIQRVHDFRIAQIEDGKKFTAQYNKLIRAYRALVRATAQRVMPSPTEQALLDRQQHYDFNELSSGEQQRLQNEMNALWGQIPEHLQQKAREMAGVS